MARKENTLKMKSTVEISANICGVIHIFACVCLPFLCPRPLSPFMEFLIRLLDHNNIWLKELYFIIVFRRYFTGNRILNYAFFNFNPVKLLFCLLVSMCSDREFSGLITFAPQDMYPFIPSAFDFCSLSPYHQRGQFSDRVLIISGFISTSSLLRLLSSLYRRAYAFH